MSGSKILMQWTRPSTSLPDASVNANKLTMLLIAEVLGCLQICMLSKNRPPGSSIAPLPAPVSVECDFV